MPQTKPIVSVENVVASASVDQKIDLNDITAKFPDTEYHPEQFPGLVFRLKTPRTATLIFRTGKMVFHFLNSIIFLPDIIKSANGCDTDRHFKISFSSCFNKFPRIFTNSFRQIRYSTIQAFSYDAFACKNLSSH